MEGEQTEGRKARKKREKHRHRRWMERKRRWRMRVWGEHENKKKT